MAKKLVEESSLTAVADSIREKTGGAEPLVFPEDFVAAIQGITTGGSGGTGGGGDDHEWIKDGNTHIWITLHEGRTSPMLGVCPNGTVTVDWGDGTTPDILTGTSTSTVKWTPNHEYASAGEYIITLTVDGEMGLYGNSSGGSGILRYNKSSDYQNRVYNNGVRYVEIGNFVTSIGNNAFYYCASLTNVVIPEGVTSIGGNAFRMCHSLKSVVIPEGVTSIGSYAFYCCYSLTNVVIPEGVTSIGDYVFNACYSLTNVVIPESVTSIGSNAFFNCASLTNVVIPEGVTSIDSYVFRGCASLTNVVIPEGVTSIGSDAFNGCYSLTNVVIPEGVTSIGSSAFDGCYSLTNVVIPEGVTSIERYVFNGCHGVAFYDFSNHTVVPTLSNANAFNSIPADCEFRVPAALYDEWIAATNWSTYASKIVAV